MAALNAGTTITLIEGDITAQQFENNGQSALVNAANDTLIGSAGVAYYIQKAAGDTAFRNYITTTFAGYPLCPTGQARLMPSLNIAKTGPAYIINTVGPDLKKPGAPDANEKSLLETTIKNSLTLADAGQNTPTWLTPTEQHDSFHNQTHIITTLAIPALSAGIFGYYSDLSAPVIINAIITYLEKTPDTKLTEIRIVTFGGYQGRNDYQNYAYALRQTKKCTQAHLADNTPLLLSLKKSENNTAKPFLAYTLIPTLPANT
jgi:O-acetyl-ADP-ribose deacetylase (regulator of RNase III)